MKWILWFIDVGCWGVVVGAVSQFALFLCITTPGEYVAKIILISVLALATMRVSTCFMTYNREHNSIHFRKAVEWVKNLAW